MESQPQNPEFRINPEIFTHVFRRRWFHIVLSFQGGGVPVPPPSRSVHAAN